MLDDHADGSATPETNDSAGDAAGPAAKKATRKRTTKKTAAPAEDTTGDKPEGAASAEKPKKKSAGKKTTAAKAASAKKTPAGDGDGTADGDAKAEKPAKKATRKKTTKKAGSSPAGDAPADGAGDETAQPSIAAVFQAPDAAAAAPARRTAKKAATSDQDVRHDADAGEDDEQEGDDTGDGPARRKRRRGGRRRRKPGSGENADAQSDQADDSEARAPGDSGSEPAEGESTSSRRRRRRRRTGEDGGDSNDDPANTVTRVRSGRSAADEITAVSGSTRLEAKKQRRREGREAGRRRAPIVSEAEFLARRESVNRVMVIRQRDDITQIGVIEDNVLVEHYVARESQTSLIGNVYLGRVQNVLPSMEAAFIDIGKGRNAVLYAGEVNWSALGHKEGQPRKIESVLSSGQTVLVQVTKDPIGHKGARLTSQISLAGRFLVYVPDGTTSGISRKLPDTERNRLKTLLKEIVPEQAGVIVRTAAEGASEEELTRDVERLTARWDDIEKKAANKSAGASLLYGEPDLTLKVVRDLFTEDFTKLVIEGDEAWETVQGYVVHVAPDLEDRLERYVPKKDQDIFAAYRIDEQIKKGLDRKVWLPSGGSLVIDRTEAMTVVDVNTGKFTGSGGNLEETVTKNNLEAAEEMVRQLRLRDIGGIIVVDFIDMVLESNRDLVLRRLVECLGRDRTRHQVAEVTSLGLVQMTRKRIGTGLLESFSHDCPHCHGRGVIIEDAPVEPKKAEEEPRRARRNRSRGRTQETSAPEPPKPPSPKDLAAMARQPEEHPEEHPEDQAEDLAEDQAADQLLAEVEPFDDTTEGTEAEVEVESGPEPEAPVEPEAVDLEPVPPQEPEKPRVVTRTRRRSASRPAGPPASNPGGGADGAPEQPADETPALHVPVKRKGARKR
ncbi:Rne/Rng family ribonuclease [Nocardioides sp.]|uniref:Rne/Rng family ribonuclease n=1 Tax=Nocardioides sp. TaxID=35761 RepID=UPI002F42ADCD